MIRGCAAHGCDLKALTPVTARNLLDAQGLPWMHYLEGPDYTYSVSYWGTILYLSVGARRRLVSLGSEQLLPFSSTLMRYHFVNAIGELHVQTFESGKRMLDYVRKPGDYVKKPSGNVHMEQRGPTVR